MKRIYDHPPALIPAALGLVMAFCAPLRYLGFFFLFIALTIFFCRYRKKLTLILAGICLFIFSLVEIPIISGATAKAEKDLDYILVLGAALEGSVPSGSLMDRLNRACEYLEENPGTRCVVSGGQGAGEDLPEGEAMKKTLVLMGIKEDRILVEDRSVNTNENIKFSAAIIEEDSGKNAADVRVGIVSSEFHIFRALFLAKKHGYTFSGVPAPSQNKIIMVNYFIREAVGMAKAVILDH